ncbi:MAG: hypothetical protein CMQ54_03300 [Gammaproteobacteria bacterium]|nr:hypothetical protein [Gammaproteobacteria bacterium]|tara:strand:+ start:11 stop:211 length:201 start_codon:yes stop_codon:yes gene_type:complete
MTTNKALVITCYFCFEQFDINLEIHENFSGHDTDIYDCFICCNPNKISYEFDNGEIISMVISDGNE